MQSSWSVLIAIFLHLKGVVVFCQSTFLLCSNTFMVMSPHFLVILTDPFQLSLHQETAFAQFTGSPYPLLVPLAGSLYGHFICVWACSTASGGCVPMSHPYSPLVSQSLMRLNPKCSVSFLQLFHHQGQPWLWLDWNWGWQVPALCSELGPASGTSSGMLLSPCVELWSLLALTPWESTQVLLLQWRLSELLEEQPCFFCVEMARNSANGHPTGVVPIKGISGQRDMMGGGVSERHTGLLEGPRAVDSSGLGAAVVAGAFLPSHMVTANASLI